MVTEPEANFVSTGNLPKPPDVQRLVTEAFSRFRGEQSGLVADQYPALATADPSSFGICVADVTGSMFVGGDADCSFTIMSVSKPFVFALVCQVMGPSAARDAIGVNSTGLPFNSIEAVDRSSDGRTNPMVNSGALATTSYVPGSTASQQWAFILDGLSKFAGERLAMDEAVYASAMLTNQRNRELAEALASRMRIRQDPHDVVDVYTRQCCVSVSARTLARMGATLANGGCNPHTRERVVDQDVCHYTLAVMATAGLYETSGEWLYDVGLPGKSGIAGGIITIAPGKGALATYSPPLDEAGNSVRGQLVAKDLSRRLGLDMFAS